MYKFITRRLLPLTLIMACLCNLTWADLEQSIVDMVDEDPTEITTTEAITSSGGQMESIVTELIAEPAIFNITVPTSIPVYSDSRGHTVVGEVFDIVNSSAGPIEVSEISIVAQNGWTLTDFNTDFSDMPIDSYTFAISLFDDNCVVMDEDYLGYYAYVDTDSVETIIKSGEVLTVDYDVKISYASELYYYDFSIASIMITLDWVYDKTPSIQGITNGEIIELSEGDTYELPEVSAYSYDGDELEVVVSGYTDEPVYEDHTVTFSVIDTDNNTSLKAYMYVMIQAPQQILSLLG